MTAIADTPNTEPLWTRVRASFARAVAILGAPAAIAAHGCLDRRVGREIVRWLCSEFWGIDPPLSMVFAPRRLENKAERIQ